jgi:cytochrome c2
MASRLKPANCSHQTLLGQFPLSGPEIDLMLQLRPVGECCDGAPAGMLEARSERAKVEAVAFARSRSILTPLAVFRSGRAIMKWLRSGLGLFIGVCLLFAAALAASGAAAADQEVFRARCIGCHAMKCNRNGPKLAGLFGRKAGSVADFNGYTKEMKASRITWSRETLDKFLNDPGAMIPGTAMTAAGKLEGAADRKQVIDFIASGDTSLDLCF